MPNNGLKTIILLIFICMIAPAGSYAQILEDDPKVDSVFESLSITEQISQLLLIDARHSEPDYTDIPFCFGGILLNEQSPYRHFNKLTKLQKFGNADYLIFSELSKTGGLKMDSVWIPLRYTETESETYTRQNTYKDFLHRGLPWKK